jgi:hypothetical protein
MKYRLTQDIGFMDNQNQHHVFKKGTLVIKEGDYYRTESGIIIPLNPNWLVEEEKQLTQVQ